VARLIVLADRGCDHQGVKGGGCTLHGVCGCMLVSQCGCWCGLAQLALERARGFLADGDVEHGEGVPQVVDAKVPATSGLPRLVPLVLKVDWDSALPTPLGDTRASRPSVVKFSMWARSMVATAAGRGAVEVLAVLFVFRATLPGPLTCCT